MPGIHYHVAKTEKHENVFLGDAVGFIDGPGQWPTNKIGVVLGFGSDRWSDEYVVIRRNDGDNDRVETFTTVGIGIYHLPTHLHNLHLRQEAA